MSCAHHGVRSAPRPDRRPSIRKAVGNRQYLATGTRWRYSPAQAGQHIDERRVSAPRPTPQCRRRVPFAAIHRVREESGNDRKPVLEVAVVRAMEAGRRRLHATNLAALRSPPRHPHRGEFKPNSRRCHRGTAALRGYARIRPMPKHPYPSGSTIAWPGRSVVNSTQKRGTSPGSFPLISGRPGCGAAMS